MTVQLMSSGALPPAGTLPVWTFLWREALPAARGRLGINCQRQIEGVLWRASLCGCSGMDGSSSLLSFSCFLEQTYKCYGSQTESPGCRSLFTAVYATMISQTITRMVRKISITMGCRRVRRSSTRSRLQILTLVSTISPTVFTHRPTYPFLFIDCSSCP